jgi:plastocyanin
MKKILLSIVFLTLGATGFCIKWTVINSAYTYSPATLTITAGDSVEFVLATIHNAAEVDLATWNANGTTALPGGFLTPFGGGLVLPEKLTVGTHYYVCQNHVATMGMKGTIIVQPSVGITENAITINFSIYPNPSHGKFNVDLNTYEPSKNYDLTVFDLLGNQVYYAPNLNRSASTPIDLSKDLKGIYFIRLTDGREIYTKKVIIQ